MSEPTQIAATLLEIQTVTGVQLPAEPPVPDCTFVTVAWNEEKRIEVLLDIAKEWFPYLVVGVQESTDSTLQLAGSIADRPGDQVLREPHHGYGDASMPRLLDAVKTKWAFVVSCDELPSVDLLQSTQAAMAYADFLGAGGVWVEFHSIIEGIEYVEQHGHLRLFRAELGWPRTLHSRPKARVEIWWPYGHIRHERSLDEMMQDYLRYWDIGRGNVGWESHNRQMMHDACESVALSRGWDFVRSHGWWPAVQQIAFIGEGSHG